MEYEKRILFVSTLNQYKVFLHLNIPVVNVKVNGQTGSHLYESATFKRLNLIFLFKAKKRERKRSLCACIYIQKSWVPQRRTVNVPMVAFTEMLLRNEALALCQLSPKRKPLCKETRQTTVRGLWHTTHTFIVVLFEELYQQQRHEVIPADLINDNWETLSQQQSVLQNVTRVMSFITLSILLQHIGLLWQMTGGNAVHGSISPRQCYFSALR